MRREYKWRVWNRELEEMGQQFHKIVYSEDGHESDVVSFKFGRGICFPLQSCLNSSKFVVMAFTGLHDCEKNHVYEDDILLSKDKMRKYVIKYDDRFGQYYRSGIGQACDERNVTHTEWNDYTILGNIHQHPSLLESNHDIVGGWGQ